MKKIFIKTIILFVFSMIYTLFFVIGCSGQMGYGVMLWSLPEYGIADGDIVPIYIRSNIGGVYAIGVPDTDEKIEVPLWQVTEPESKSNAEKTAQLYVEYQYRYASVKINGLYIRAEAKNTAKQVYRLRQDEIIKILYKGTGQPVIGTAGDTLEGDWFMVLTSDGTIGWCFSYNLSIFDEREGIPKDVLDGEQKTDEVLKNILSQNWYPEYYKTMIDQNKIDLSRIRRDYRFNIDTVSGQLNLGFPELKVSYPYVGTTKRGRNEYVFTGTPITITVRNSERIGIQYINEDGFPFMYSFVTLYELTATSDGSDDAHKEYIEGIIRDEVNRRLEQYQEVVAVGPIFSSSNYGKLTFTSDKRFNWTGYQRLINEKIINTANGRDTIGDGSVEIKYFISTGLVGQFDGVLTFRFDNSDEEVNFLYKIEEDGLRLENSSNTAIQNETVMEQSHNPLVMFFAKSQ